MSQIAGLSARTDQTIKADMPNLNLRSGISPEIKSSSRGTDPSKHGCNLALLHRTSNTPQDQVNKRNPYTHTNRNPNQLYKQINTLGFRLLTSISSVSRFRQRRPNLRFLRRVERREELANNLRMNRSYVGEIWGRCSCELGTNQRLVLVSGGRSAARAADGASWFWWQRHGGSDWLSSTSGTKTSWL